MPEDLAVADSALTPNVFLDTEAFVAHQLDFQSPNLRRLVRLAVEGTIRLLLTTVTESEVRVHLDRHAKDVFKQIQNYSRACRIVKKLLPPEVMAALSAVDEEAIRKGLHDEFDEFIAESVATVLRVDQISPEAIFKKYFERKAPFGDGGKKSEFPDAFAVAALEKWSADNTNAKAYVVTEDGDWRRSCRDGTTLLHVSKLRELLELFADSVLVTAIKAALHEKREELKHLIEQEAMDLDYFAGDQLVDGEVDAVEDADVEIEGFHVVEAKDGSASVNVDCKVTVSLSIVADDADSGIYDHEDKCMHYVYRCSGTVTRDLERVVEITLAYVQLHPERVTISTAKFEDNSVDLDVEEGELTRDDDNDYSD